MEKKAVGQRGEATTRVGILAREEGPLEKVWLFGHLSELLYAHPSSLNTSFLRMGYIGVY